MRKYINIFLPECRTSGNNIKYNNEIKEKIETIENIFLKADVSKTDKKKDGIEKKNSKSTR